MTPTPLHLALVLVPLVGAFMTATAWLVRREEQRQFWRRMNARLEPLLVTITINAQPFIDAMERVAVAMRKLGVAMQEYGEQMQRRLRPHGIDITDTGTYEWEEWS